jgi:2-methylisocitrate lyase-like PEP mutase family enzyme
VDAARAGAPGHGRGQRQALREAISSRKLLIAPGVWDGLSARVAQAAGFEAVYLSGGSVARGTGVPDLGLLTMSEMLARLREVRDSVDCPVIADADTGYGGTLNVARTVREYERMGAAALHLEDQVIPKRCGHYAEKALVPPSTMVARIQAALDARSDPALLIIARTDARASEGLDAAIDRGRRYAEAGADMLFVEGPESEAEFAAIAEALDIPLVLNMSPGGASPRIAAAHAQELGYALMIVPSDLQRAAIFAMQRAAGALLREGSTASFEDQMVSPAERDRVVGLESYLALEKRYGE